MKLSSRFAALIGLAATQLLPFISVVQSAAAQQTTPDAAAVMRGKGAYASGCSFCHGSQATGTEQAPNLMRSPLVFQDKDGDVLAPFLKQGRPTLGMPSFAALPASQVSDIVAFLHARLAETHTHRLPETAMIVGDAEAGRSYFNGEGKCNTCHSVTGDLAGIGAKLQPLALTTAFLTPAAKPRQARAVLPSGQIVEGTLQYSDEFTIALEDSLGVYHSWPRSALKSADVTDPLAFHEQMLPRYTDQEIHDLLAYLVTLK